MNGDYLASEWELPRELWRRHWITGKPVEPDFLEADEERELRRCANGEWLGCLAVVVSFLAGFVAHWIVAWP